MGDKPKDLKPAMEYGEVKVIKNDRPPRREVDPGKTPVKTVGSYWPYAPTLFDYIRRAMPQSAPQSLSNDDVYAVSAYILHLNGLLPADAEIDAKTLAAIKMPNRNMFVGDPRPDVKNPACMSGC